MSLIPSKQSMQIQSHSPSSLFASTALLSSHVATSAHKFTDATYDDDWQQRQQQEGITALHRRRYRWRCHRCTLEPKSPNKSLLNSDTTIHIFSTLSASAVFLYTFPSLLPPNYEVGVSLIPFQKLLFQNSQALAKMRT